MFYPHRPSYTPARARLQDRIPTYPIRVFKACMQEQFHWNKELLHTCWVAATADTIDRSFRVCVYKIRATLMIESVGI